MASQVTNYRCPNCAGPLHFVGESGKLECDYCGSSFEVAEVEALYASKDEKAVAVAEQTADRAVVVGSASSAPASPAPSPAVSSGPQQTSGDAWDASGLNADWGREADNLRVYSCPSCGAELICDASTAATSCPYCGNPAIVPGQFAGALKPDFVVPFKLSKDDAVEKLKAHYKGKIFLPGSFTSENHIQEIKGIYVPFWMFDGQAEGDARYDATRSRSYTSGDYEITETDHYEIYREGSVSFEKVPVDASSKMPDDHMDSIEPYDYSELKPFSTAYLPGFLADRFDVSVEDSVERADRRCASTLEEAFRDSVSGYDTCVHTGGSIALHRGKVHYALMPVWMLSTEWQGRNFLFTMNGQTGRLVGDLPVSRAKFWGLFAAIAVPLSVLASVAVTMFLA